MWELLNTVWLLKSEFIKEIIKQINVIRKRLGMKPMSEEFELNEEFSEKDFDALIRPSAKNKILNQR